MKGNIWKDVEKFVKIWTTILIVGEIYIFPDFIYCYKFLFVLEGYGKEILCVVVGGKWEELTDVTRVGKEMGWKYIGFSFSRQNWREI